MKLNISKEWCLSAAKREGDAEIGAGAIARDPVFSELAPPTPDQAAYLKSIEPKPVDLDQVVGGPKPKQA